MPDFNSWLGGQMGRTVDADQGDDGQQNYFSLNSLGERGRLDGGVQDLQNFFNSNVAKTGKDGNPVWGNRGVDFNPTSAPTAFGAGTDPNGWFRVGDLDLQGVTASSNPQTFSLLNQLKQQNGGNLDSLLKYDPEYGQLLEPGAGGQLRSAFEKDNKANDGMLSNPMVLMAIMASMAAGGAGLAGLGAMEGAGAAGAGMAGDVGWGGMYDLFGSGAMDAALPAEAAGAGEAFGGGVGDLPLGTGELGAGQSGMLQSIAPNFPGMTGAPASALGASPTDMIMGGAGAGGGMDSIEQLLKKLGEDGSGVPGGGAPEGGTTPDASMKGMLDKLGSGVTPQDMGRLALSSNFGDVGNLLSRFAFGGPQIGGSGMSISPMSVIQGLSGLFQQNKLKKLSEQLSGMADPQAPYRGARAAELDTLMKDPSKITEYPGYQAGLEAVQRSRAAQGYNGSGNMMASLAKYGGDFFNNAVSQLNGLAGGSPGGAANLRYQGSVDSTNLLGQSLNRIGYGLSGGPNTAQAWTQLRQLMNLGG